MNNNYNLYSKPIIYTGIPYPILIVFSFLGFILFVYLLYRFIKQQNKQNFFNLSTFLVVLGFIIVIPVKNYIVGELFTSISEVFVPAFSTYFIIAPLICWVIDKFVIKNKNVIYDRYFQIYWLLLFIVSPTLAYIFLDL